jgi:ribonuclease HI
MTHRLTIFCDGLCEPRNPGGYGCCAFIVFEGIVSGRAEVLRPPCVYEQHGCIGHGPEMTNNVAEYRAVRAALKWLLANAPETLCDVFTDSQLVVEQANGRWNCKAMRLIPLRNECQALLEELPRARLRWVKREENDVADALTRIAYEKARRAA